MLLSRLQDRLENNGYLLSETLVRKCDGNEVHIFTYNGNQDTPIATTAKAIEELLRANPTMVPLFEKGKVTELISLKKYLVVSKLPGDVVTLCFTKRSSNSSSNIDHLDQFFSYARLSEPVRCRRGQHIFEKTHAEFWQQKHTYCPGQGCGLGVPMLPAREREFSIDQELKKKIDQCAKNRKEGSPNLITKQMNELVEKNKRLEKEKEALIGQQKQLVASVKKLPASSSRAGQAVKSLQTSLTATEKNGEIVIYSPKVTLPLKRIRS